MAKTLLDCGNCGLDFHSIRTMVSRHFDATVIQTHGAADTLDSLRSMQVDLVTVNRRLDRDRGDGFDVVRRIKADPTLASIPIMLVTNYEEHQRAAIAAGCVRGFGKLALGDAETIAVLAPFLGDA